MCCQQLLWKGQYIQSLTRNNSNNTDWGIFYSFLMYHPFKKICLNFFWLILCSQQNKIKTLLTLVFGLARSIIQKSWPSSLVTFDVVYSSSHSSCLLYYSLWEYKRTKRKIGSEYDNKQIFMGKKFKLQNIPSNLSV